MENIENIQVNSNLKNKRKNFFAIFITIFASIIILIFLVNILMTNSEVNQGKYRVADVIVTSGVILEDTREETNKWTFNVHQNNKISILIVPAIEKFSASITDIVATASNLEIYQVGSEEGKININNTNNLNLVTSKNEDGNVLYEIEIVNGNVLNNFEIPNDITEIKHDGTMLGLAGIKNNELQYTIAFNLKLQDETGKSSIMNVNFKLPQGDITLEGSKVSRQDLSKYIFKVK